MPVVSPELSSELQKALTAIRQLAASHGALRLEAFGSAVRGELHEGSDVDLIVIFKPMKVLEHGQSFFGLKHGLEDLLGRPVDLLEHDAITNPYFLKAIEPERVLLYAA